MLFDSDPRDREMEADTVVVRDGTVLTDLVIVTDSETLFVSVVVEEPEVVFEGERDPDTSRVVVPDFERVWEASRVTLRLPDGDEVSDTEACWVTVPVFV